MFKINKSEVHLTRGDSAQFTVNLMFNNGAQYTIEPTDTLVFSMKLEKANDLSLQKEVTGTTTINLLPSDTASLSCGKYKYDIRLLKGEDVYTVVSYADFFLEKEVGTIE